MDCVIILFHQFYQNFFHLCQNVYDEIEQKTAEMS